MLCGCCCPPCCAEVVELARDAARVRGAAVRLAGRGAAVAAGRLPGVALPELELGGLQGAAVRRGQAARSASRSTWRTWPARLSLTVVLATSSSATGTRLLLRLELLPQAWRATAVRMGNAVARELRLYLQGQLMIAGAVAVLAAVALAIVGVRSALVLGGLVGLLNMIPYFGPFIGGVPAVLIALGDGWQKAALTVVALTVVQQLDGSWISPRIMGSLTGFSPALVLVGIYGGARLGGVAGMLLALPVMMTSRTLFRVFVQKCENI